MGLDVWLHRHEDSGGSEKEVEIEHNSAKYPEHYFKVGYFRSSYNDSGIDRVLGSAIGVRLADLFGVSRDEYRVRPDWKSARAKTEEALSRFRAYVEESPFRVIKASYNEFTGHPNHHEIDSGEKALSAFLAERKKYQESKSEMDGYSNVAGDFFLKEPLQVHALISGVNKRFFVDEKLPCTFVVYKAEGLNWYVEALEIVIETIDYVLSQPDPEKYVLHWSA